MLKNLVKVSIVVSLGLSATACQTNNPNSSKVTTVSSVSTENRSIKQNRWSDFKEGFNRKKSFSQAVDNAGKTLVNGSVNSEYGVKKFTIADRINQNKWKEFQKAFTERVGTYLSNIADAIR